MPVTVLRAGHRGRRRRHLVGADPPAGQEPAGDGRAASGSSTRTQPIAVDDVVRYLVGGRRRAARPTAGSSRSAGPTR